MILPQRMVGPALRPFAIGLALMTAACGSLNLLPKPEEPQLYVLRPQVTSTMGPVVAFRLAVGTPDAPASLDTARIALFRSPTTMDYFANAAWTDRVPLLVQRMLIEAFENSMRIVAVDRDIAGIDSDFLLETELRNFAAHYDSPDAAPEVRVTVLAKVVRMPERAITASIVVAQMAKAGANTLGSVVLAFDQAAGAAIGDIVRWTLSMPSPALSTTAVNP